MKRRIEVLTGTRTDDRSGEAARYLDSIREQLFCVIVGDCPTGVDEEVRAWCESNGVNYLVAKALWMWTKRKTGTAGGAGPRRNGFMSTAAKAMALGLSKQTELFVVHGAAFPSRVKSRGTQNSVSWFKKLEILHEVF